MQAVRDPFRRSDSVKNSLANYFGMLEDTILRFDSRIVLQAPHENMARGIIGSSKEHIVALCSCQ